MDPNANLAEQLRLAAQIIEADTDDRLRAELADRLAELVQALNEWISRRGALPDAWRHSNEAW